MPEGKSLGGLLRIEGRYIDGCPYEQIRPETWEMISAFHDWESGHTPVSVGRAEWLPSSYVDAMHAVRSCVNEQTNAAHERARQRAKDRRN